MLSNARSAILIMALELLSLEDLRWLVAIILEHDRNVGGPITPAQLRAVILRGQP